jgi:hypothetical protein
LLLLFPQNFKREEQNFVVQNEINNLSFLTGDSKIKMSKVAFIIMSLLTETVKTVLHLPLIFSGGESAARVVMHVHILTLLTSVQPPTALCQHALQLSLVTGLHSAEAALSLSLLQYCSNPNTHIPRGQPVAISPPQGQGIDLLIVDFLKSCLRLHSIHWHRQQPLACPASLQTHYISQSLTPIGPPSSDPPNIITSVSHSLMGRPRPISVIESQHAHDK